MTSPPEDSAPEDSVRDSAPSEGPAPKRRPHQRKQVLLRLDPQVYEALARWAGDELRSANAQIEFLVSLTAIWAFATVLTGREAARLFSVSAVVEEIGYPVEDTVRVLQQERRQTLVHLADPRASDGLAALERSRTATEIGRAHV